MSSHHFVREGQEPALLVVDALADDHLMSMLEWSPMVLAVVTAMPKVASWGIRVDTVFVDERAHNDCVVYDAEPHAGPAVIVDCTTGLVSSVLLFLRNRRQYALQVMTKLSEENFSAWGSADDFQITLLDATMKWSRIRSGNFEKWMPEDASLELRADAAFEVSEATQSGNQITAHRSGIVRILSSAPFWVGEHHR
jgi:hypothetical protein